ncbi:hypothetical protein [Bosea sp. MMO-172]|uniref:hypothetical protein n=1 Tax=Bosea sp. MMO-172 TaxID=3127885 RepID=UPI003019C0A2
MIEFRQTNLSFSEIFEAEGRWLMGPAILGDMIEAARGSAPEIYLDGSSAALMPPRRVTEYLALVPEELRPLVDAALDRALGRWVDWSSLRRSGGVKVMLSKYLYMASSERLAVTIQADLAAVEFDRRACGEGEFWEFVSDEFGFGRFPPQPGKLLRPTA